jgi:hypothetical protein
LPNHCRIRGGSPVGVTAAFFIGAGARMHESEKLAEAEYFYAKLLDPAESRGFIHHLRALLTSSRSVLQYAYNEAESRPDALAWYERTVQDPIIQFLRDVRNTDVHERPVGTNQTIQVGAAVLTIGSAPHMTQHDRQPSTTIHEFAGWSGAEDVPTLCRLYLDRLGALIADGQSRGFLTRPA